MNVRTMIGLLRDACHAWNEDKAPQLGAALAYYSVFSLSPLLVIAIALAGLIFGQAAAQGQVVDQLKGMVGEPIALALQQILANASDPGGSTSALVVGLVTLLFGASGVFGQLQESLNIIWKVQPKPNRGVRGLVRDRFLSVTMVLGTGFLLVGSLVVTAALSALNGSLSSLPGIAYIWHPVNLVVSFGVVTLLFAMIYRFLPDAEVAWRDVWIGAVITSVLFTLGKFLLGWYLVQGSVTSPYGAAGSLVVILLWVYYSSQILLFGAEFTRVHAERFGSGVKPKPNAELVSKRGKPDFTETS
jgi:membrane protein